ncbi:MAG: phosphate ABC transporter substrate-binding protein PstS [Chloroflexota bacterium]
MFKKVIMLIALLAFAVNVAACATPTAAPTSAPVKVVETKVVEQTKVVEKVVEKVITPTPGPAAPKPGSIVLNAAGASFPYPVYSRWFFEYAYVNPTVRINYNPIGSGGGISQITAKTIIFGGSDAPMTDAEYAKAPGIQMFPTVAGPVVPVYNIKDDAGKMITATLKFPATALGDIYLGKIAKWNDPVLANANPDVKLPAKDIKLIVRADGSGTTYTFTDYLAASNPDYKAKMGGANKLPKWPVATLAGNQNPGVTALVQNTDGAIGYVEISYAKEGKLPYGAVQNKAGEYVKATPEGVQAAMADFGNDLGDKLTVSIVNAPSKAAYPIATYTYMMVYMDQTDCVQGKAMLDFFKWAMSPEADKFAVALDYVPLPDAVQKIVETKLSKVTCQGKPF